MPEWEQKSLFLSVSSYFFRLKCCGEGWAICKQRMDQTLHERERLWRGGKMEITALSGKMVEWWSYVSKYSAPLSCLIKHFHINLFAVSTTRFTVYRKSGWKCQTCLTYLNSLQRNSLVVSYVSFHKARGAETKSRPRENCQWVSAV